MGQHMRLPRSRIRKLLNHTVGENMSNEKENEKPIHERVGQRFQFLNKVAIIILGLAFLIALVRCAK